MIIKETHLKNIIKEVVNEWKIKSEIDNIVLEELGVSREVASVSNRIIDKIQQMLPNLSAQKIEYGVFLKTGHIEENIIGNRLSIAFRIYNFSDKAIFESKKEKYQNEIFSSNSSFDGRISMVWINVYAISGTLQKKQAAENIRHEIEHIFQQKSAKKNLPSQEYYGIVRANLNSNDKIEQSVAIALYYAYHFESDGFANGLSGYIDDEPYPIEWEDIKSTDAYQSLINAKKNCVYLKSISENELAPYLKPYNLSVAAFFKRISDGESYFIHKIGKILSRHRNSLNERHIFLGKINEKSIILY